MTVKTIAKVGLIAKVGFIPTYAHDTDAGADLRADIGKEIPLLAGMRHTFPTGVKIALPDNVAGFIRSRSGLAKNYGVIALEGTIDPGYRGEIGITLINLGNKLYSVRPGDRIAQLILVPIIRAEFVRVKELGDSDRGEDGFGSSGR